MRLFALIGVVVLAGNGCRTSQPEPPDEPFRPVAAVLTSPRCLNCHPRGDRPFQGENGRPHFPAVERGAHDDGAPGLHCATCHGDELNRASGVPGAPHWRLAPRSMGWEGLAIGDLCRALTDPQKNGGRDIPALTEHMTQDSLVQSAWTPGPRPPPPLGQAEFHDAVRKWAAADARCPD
jgi:hypothetical protein